MADTKISALTALTGANVDAAADFLVIVDTSVTTTKKILVNELLGGQPTTTVFAGATTLLTIGGTGATAVVAIPGTLEASGTTGALTVAGGAYIAKKLNVAGITTLSAALTYGGVTLTNAVTGTGKMALDTSPTIATPTVTGISTLGVKGLMEKPARASVSTATAIWTSTGGPGFFIIVVGDDGTNRFLDTVALEVTTGTAPTTISSTTTVGSPAARTYTYSSGALRLAMASGTYDVDVIVLGAIA